MQKFLHRLFAKARVGAFAMGAYATTPASTTAASAIAQTQTAKVVKKPAHKKIKVSNKVTQSVKVRPATL